MGERTRGGHACGLSDAGQWGEHLARENPSSQETERQEEHENHCCCGSKSAKQERLVPRHDATERADHIVGDVSQEEVERLPWLACEPCGREHQEACEHEEAGVAEGELEPDAQTWSSIHALLRRAPCPDACRCGSRRRPRSR